jgi:hypothetical protein
MRKFIRAAIVLVILVAAYWGWALVGAAQLASVASQGDAAAVMQRVDLSALRRSLGSQIAHAYLEQNPQFKKLLSLEQGFVGSVATLLNKGRVGLSKAGAPGAEMLWRMPPLGDAFRSGPLQVLMHSYFDGPLGFVVDLDSAEGRYGVHLHLSGSTWRLSGLDLPEEVSARLAREIAERVGGLIERNGG